MHSDTPPPAFPPAVLVVDDDDGVRDVCATLLDVLGFRARGARGGAEALAALPDVDVVLLDLHMPQMGGAEVLEAVRRVRPDVKVVVMSGRPREDLDGWLESGANGVLRKPFGLGELGSSLASVCS